MGKAEIIIAKNRHGQTQDIRCRFVGQYGKFMDDDDTLGFAGDIGLTEDLRFDSITMPSKMNDMDDDPENPAF